MEDDATVAEVRRTRERKPVPNFMSTGELIYLRKNVIKASQVRLCEQLISPTTGMPVSRAILQHWETGRRKIPLWAARRVRDLGETFQKYDSRSIE